jgi:hypothetical protein
MKNIIMTIFFYNNMMMYIKVGLFLKKFPSYDQFIIQLSIVDIKLMSGPLCIIHLVKQMVGFTKRTKKYQINKRKGI